MEACSQELDWVRDNAPPAYQVPNACRALRYVEEGLLSSKVAAGEWVGERLGGRRRAGLRRSRLSGQGVAGQAQGQKRTEEGERYEGLDWARELWESESVYP